jgi:hypothetical protein
VLKQQHKWRNELQEQGVLTGIPNMRPYVKTLPHVVRGQQQQRQQSLAANGALTAAGPAAAAAAATAAAGKRTTASLR